MQSLWLITSVLYYDFWIAMRKLISSQKFCNIWVIRRTIHYSWIQLSRFLLSYNPEIRPKRYCWIICFQSGWPYWRCLFLYENRDSTLDSVLNLVTELYLSYSCAGCTPFENNLDDILISDGWISRKTFISYWSIIIHKPMTRSSRHRPINAILSISTGSCIEWCDGGAQCCSG
jgi:hypothetical protein